MPTVKVFTIKPKLNKRLAFDVSLYLEYNISIKAVKRDHFIGYKNSMHWQ